MIVQWILDSWSQISFRACAIKIATDSSEDHLIDCLKEGSTCAAGAERLKNHLKVIESEECNDVNPFSTMAEGHIEDATQPLTLITKLYTMGSLCR